MNNGITVTDIFCCAGGESIGLAAAGLDITLAANHWDRAIETHSANFSDTDQWIGQRIRAAMNGGPA